MRIKLFNLRKLWLSLLLLVGATAIAVPGIQEVMDGNVAKVGDTVTIMATRKLSATKRWRLVSIDKKAELSVKEAEAELKEEIIEAEAAAEAAKPDEAPVEEEAKAEEPKEEKEAE